MAVVVCSSGYWSSLETEGLVCLFGSVCSFISWGSVSVGLLSPMGSVPSSELLPSPRSSFSDSELVRMGCDICVLVGASCEGVLGRVVDGSGGLDVFGKMSVGVLGGEERSVLIGVNTLSCKMRINHLT